MKGFGAILLLVITLIACTSEAEQNEVWSMDETFKENNQTYYGREGRFALVKVNGKQEEPDFPAGNQGRLYHLYFWGEPDELIGKTYTLTGTHEEADKSIELYKWRIMNNNDEQIAADAMSGAKFRLSEPGLWLLEVRVEGETFTSFIIDAEK